MFERFGGGAREAVVRAHREAKELRHPCIGTEHLLLGLVSLERDVAGQVLREHGLVVPEVRRRVIATVDDGLDPGALATLGIDLEEVRRTVEAAFGPGALDGRRRRRVRSGHLPVSKRAKKVLELSLRECLRLKQDRIVAGHLLLGLIREGGGLAARIMVDAGIDLEALREEVDRLLAAQAA